MPGKSSDFDGNGSMTYITIFNFNAHQAYSLLFALSESGGEGTILTTESC